MGSPFNKLGIAIHPTMLKMLQLTQNGSFLIGQKFFIDEFNLILFQSDNVFFFLKI